MAETLRIIGILMEGLVDTLFENTGRKVLSWSGLKSNAFVQVLVGILFFFFFSIVFGPLIFSVIGR